jgi:hypothetical protein
MITTKLFAPWDDAGENGGPKLHSVIPNGFQWNEAILEPGHPLNNSLLSLLVIKDDLSPKLIGTAFLVTAEGDSATAISAAHSFEEIRRLIDPDHQRHHPSTHYEFAPLPNEVELDRVKAIYVKNNSTVAACPIEISIWDNNADVAVLKVIAPYPERSLFEDFFRLTGDIPKVGEEIAMIGYGDMQELVDLDNPNRGKLKRRLVVRVGRVYAMHSNGFHALKAACVETTIAIYGGMSGGIAARWAAPEAPIEPFGFISYTPTPEILNDRSKSGHACATLLNLTVQRIGDQQQIIGVPINNARVGRLKAMINPEAWLRLPKK